MWDLNTMRCRHTLKGHASRVRALALSGSLLFSGSNDKSIKVRNLDSYSNSTTPNPSPDPNPHPGVEPRLLLQLHHP